MSQETQRQSTASAAGHGDPNSEAGLMLNQSCFDLMMIEMVPMATRLAEQLHAQHVSLSNKDKDSKAATAAKLDEDELNDAIFYRLESLGYRVGLGVVESLTAHLPLPHSSSSPLDTIKYLCKDLWTAIFRKQIDNLKTNHRGVFVLTDNSFMPLRRCSLEAGRADEARRRAGALLYFPQGLVRGLLSGLGLDVGPPPGAPGSGATGGQGGSVEVGVGAGGIPGVVVTVRIGGAKTSVT